VEETSPDGPNLLEVASEYTIMEALLAVTPFTPHETDGPSFGDPLYQSDKYRKFLETIHTQADMTDTEVEKIIPTLGVWKQRYEPSVLLTLRADDYKSILNFSEQLGKTFQQESVRVIQNTTEGPHFTYVFSTDVQPVTTIKNLLDSGVQGARLTEDAIHIDSMSVLSASVLNSLQKYFGAPIVRKCELNVLNLN
jgi:hypothetical protein